uniref:BolA family member 2 n=1 Tax=Monodelphis domestica TaxID=13616 RepID=F7EII3_MONDO
MELSAESLREKLLRELEAEHVVSAKWELGWGMGSTYLPFCEFWVGVAGGRDRGGVLAPTGQHFNLSYPGQEVEDTTPARCAASFRVLVVSSKFQGKPLLQRHRLVNSCLSEELPHIHAFEQKTLTPEQWDKERQK